MIVSKSGRAKPTEPRKRGGRWARWVQDRQKIAGLASRLIWLISGCLNGGQLVGQLGEMQYWGIDFKFAWTGKTSNPRVGRILT